ncbi:MAG: type IV pilin N-terminal domain-containing protein [Methanoregula sp.]|nr:type IV pilin N-terminal domain-containing protein [Methanoregula sp.]
MMRCKDAAVSPVVGVMLMLVVTIIIAAVVSAFAGGMASGTSKAPQASIAVTATLPPTGNETVFANNGGDTFDINDIKVMFQSQDTKTTLTTTDVGTNCIAFKKVGSTSSTLIKPGDSFEIIGSASSYGTGIAYGSFGMYADSKITWSVIDKSSGNSIATGTLIL